MSKKLITIGVILFATILMFIFSLLLLSERRDDNSQLTVQTAIVQFVDNSRFFGKITMDNYSTLIDKINSTDNFYHIEMEVKVLDENIDKKTSGIQETAIGENTYYSIYTSQIVEALENQGTYEMKKGDIFSVTLKNTNKTLFQTIKSVFYSIFDSDSYPISVQHSGVCIVNNSVQSTITSSTSTSTSTSTSSMSTQEIDAFNDLFLTYEGAQTGSNVKALIGRLIDNADIYKDELDKIPAITLDTETVVADGKTSNAASVPVPLEQGNIDDYVQGLRLIRNELEVKHTYWIEYIYGTSGVINEIKIYYTSDHLTDLSR